jgi:hypothetical protein
VAGGRELGGSVTPECARWSRLYESRLVCQSLLGPWQALRLSVRPTRFRNWLRRRSAVKVAADAPNAACRVPALVPTTKPPTKLARTCSSKARV